MTPSAWPWRSLADAAAAVKSGAASPVELTRACLERIERVDPVVHAFVSVDAEGALQAARRLGLRIPEDLGIVGFDDIPEAAYFYPPLTTLRQDTRKLGAMAVERINKLIQAKHEGETIEPSTSWLEPRLIVRKSSVRKREVASEALPT